ncbi:MAG: hypothetical protein ACK5P6_06040 [Pseudobdellovibrionaceae bacterium]
MSDWGIGHGNRARLVIWVVDVAQTVGIGHLEGIDVELVNCVSFKLLMFGGSLGYEIKQEGTDKSTTLSQEIPRNPL